MQVQMTPLVWVSMIMWLYEQRLILSEIICEMYYGQNNASHHFSAVCVTSSPFLQIDRKHGSKFTYRCAHSPVMFVFRDHNFFMGSGACLFQALFCVYTSFINETSGLLGQRKRATSPPASLNYGAGPDHRILCTWEERLKSGRENTDGGWA